MWRRGVCSGGHLCRRPDLAGVFDPPLAISRSISLARISRLSEWKHAMRITYIKASQDLSLMMKPRASNKYQLVTPTDASQAHVEIRTDMGEALGHKNGKPLTIKEIERRRKISESKKGTIPWNKGRKHSEETIQRIREKMSEVFSDPKVRKKMKGMQGTHSKKTKELMSIKHKQIWDERLKQKPYQDKLHTNWAEIVASTAKIGGYGERELNWDSYYKIKAELISEAEKEKIQEKIEREKKWEEKKKEKEKNKREKEEKRRKKMCDKFLKMIEEKKAAEKGEKMRETTGKVKWRTPDKSMHFVKKRLTKLHMWKKRLETSSIAKETLPDSTGDEWDVEITKERLEIGASLLDQLQLVKDRRKAEKVSS